MKKLANKAKTWIRKNKREAILITGIILLASFLRFYKIADYMTFLGDEGRDAILVRRLLVNGDIILIGPGTSIGNMYLGPLYYYFIAPALLLFNFSPVGPSALIAFVGVLTVYLVWHVTREFFGGKGAIVAAFLYAIAPTIIIYSRSSWNPNIMPFFALLSVYSIWRVWINKQFRWLIVLGVAFAFVMQTHYLGLILAPMLGIFWLLALVQAKKDKKLKPILLASFYMLLAFSFLMSPLVIFDFRHNFINFNALKLFFLERQTTVSARPWNALPEMWPQLQKITTRLVAGRNEVLGSWAALTIIGSLLWVGKSYKTKFKGKELQAYVLLIAWIGFALVGLGVYKQEIYDHYYGFFMPALFIVIGGISQHVTRKHRIRGTWLVATAIIILAFFNFKDSPIKYPPNGQLARTVKVSGKIREEAGSDKFNLAVIAERNYEDAYQYYLEVWGTGMVDIDPLNFEETIGDRLFVVCELPRDDCDPTRNPKAEVANFGWSEIVDEWNVEGVTLFELDHTQGEN